MQSRQRRTAKSVDSLTCRHCLSDARRAFSAASAARAASLPSKRRRKPKQPADLAAFPCICMREPSGSPSRWEFARGRRRTSIDVTGRITLNAPTLIRTAALEGVGVAYLADWIVAEDVTAGRLVRVLDDWMPPATELALYYPGRRHVPAGLRALVEVISSGRAARS